jgi:hypothetical protein
MLGDVFKLAGAVLLRDSLAISDIPRAMLLVQIALLVTEVCFHGSSYLWPETTY